MNALLTEATLAVFKEGIAIHDDIASVVYSTTCSLVQPLKVEEKNVQCGGRRANSSYLRRLIRFG